MISTFLAEHYLLARVAILVVSVLVLVVAARLARAERRGRRVAGGLAIGATLGVLLLTLTPDGMTSTPAACNLAPDLFPLDVPNLALFFVPALFATVALRRPLLVLAAVLVVSAAIEAIQRLTSMNRRCDIDDWLTNSAGGAAGVLAAHLVVWVLGSRQRAWSR